MQRRRFFGVLAVGGAVALGAGYWRLPEGPAPAALSIEAALALLQRLATEPLVSRQGWSAVRAGRRPRSSTTARRALTSVSTATPN